MATWRTFWPQPQYFSLKNFLYFLKKVFLFEKMAMALSRPKIRKFLILSGFNPQNFSLKKFLIFFPKKTCSEKVSYIFSKKSFYNFFRKRNFLIFQERYIRNPSIFRTRSMLRTLVYSEPEAYSEHDGTFCKNSYLAHF